MICAGVKASVPIRAWRIVTDALDQRRKAVVTNPARAGLRL
jgi:hypothetical protein